MKDNLPLSNATYTRAPTYTHAHEEGEKMTNKTKEKVNRVNQIK